MCCWHTFPSDRMGSSRASEGGQSGIALILAVVSVFLLTVAVFQTRAGVNLAEEIARLGPFEVIFSLVAFTLVYGILMIADVVLLRKYAAAGVPDDESAEHATAGAV